MKALSTLALSLLSAFGASDLFVAFRRSTSEPFADIAPLDALNPPSDERDPWLSPDGRELYFASDRSGHYDIYVTTVHLEPGWGRISET